MNAEGNYGVVAEISEDGGWFLHKRRFENIDDWLMTIPLSSRSSSCQEVMAKETWAWWR